MISFPRTFSHSNLSFSTWKIRVHGGPPWNEGIRSGFEFGEDFGVGVDGLLFALWPDDFLVSAVHPGDLNFPGSSFRRVAVHIDIGVLCFDSVLEVSRGSAIASCSTVFNVDNFTHSYYFNKLSIRSTISHLNFAIIGFFQRTEKSPKFVIECYRTD